MKKKKNIIVALEKALFYFTIWIIILSISIILSFKFSKYGNQLFINDYLNFIGSFGGAALSSIISFLILFITIIYNSSEQEENMLNSARPILKINFVNSNDRHNCKIYYKNVDIKQNGYDNLNFKVKNIGTGPARKVEIYIKDEGVTNYGGLIEKNDLGVNEEIIINIRTKYENLLINGECLIIIKCIDIYNKRKYIFKVKAVKQKDHTSVEYFELIDENIIEL